MQQHRVRQGTTKLVCQRRDTSTETVREGAKQGANPKLGWSQISRGRDFGQQTFKKASKSSRGLQGLHYGIQERPVRFGSGLSALEDIISMLARTVQHPCCNSGPSGQATAPAKTTICCPIPKQRCVLQVCRTVALFTGIHKCPQLCSQPTLMLEAIYHGRHLVPGRLRYQYRRLTHHARGSSCMGRLNSRICPQDTADVASLHCCAAQTCVHRGVCEKPRMACSSC